MCSFNLTIYAAKNVVVFNNKFNFGASQHAFCGRYRIRTYYRIATHCCYTDHFYYSVYHYMRIVVVYNGEKENYKQVVGSEESNLEV